MNDGELSVGTQVVTFVVLATGRIGETIARLAEEHAAFDRTRRRVIRRSRTRWADGTAAAMVLNGEQQPAVFLDELCATAEEWIEAAFVQALASTSRESGH